MAEEFSSKEMFEFFQKMWNPLSFPIPGMFTPTMSVEEPVVPADDDQDARDAEERAQDTAGIRQALGRLSGLRVRINSDPPRFVIPPEVRPQVGGVGGSTGVTAVGAQGAGAALPARPAPAAPEGPPATPAPPPAERRQSPRRVEDRRKKQVPVLVDMRVSQRRRASRRSQDEAPPSVDVKA
jgi:hypothetical protein